MMDRITSMTAFTTVVPLLKQQGDRGIRPQSGFGAATSPFADAATPRAAKEASCD
jgi:hypothetical protein